MELKYITTATLSALYDAARAVREDNRRAEEESRTEGDTESRRHLEITYAFANAVEFAELIEAEIERRGFAVHQFLPF